MSQDELYEQAVADFGPAVERLANSYEFDPEKRRDLLQEIHLAMWRSLEGFDGRCSLRTWVYRVAHNVAASHVIRHRRMRSATLVGLDEISQFAGANDPAATLDQQQTIDQLHHLIRQLKPLDREVILLYLEQLDAESIAEIVGISGANVATKIHRIKKILAKRFREGGCND
jgi:RNA polymerase sigma-70 factor (ECF subfamily)